MKHTQHIAYFKVPYREKDNNNYLENDNFCCGNKGENKDDGITDNEDPELNQFYYHSDHLGSSSYITNLSGNIVQHIEYVPFGEVFLEERNNKWNTPYLFNSKELDEETGFYYYGARYYSGKTSLWLSVDPLAEKYPGVSPYCYTLNNPINLVDPDGREVFDGIVKKANRYIANVAWNFTLSVAKSINNSVKKSISKIKVTPYINIKSNITAGAQGAIKTEGLGVKINITSAELLKLSFSAEKDNIDMKMDYIGKNNKVNIYKGGNIGYEGVDVGADHKVTYSIGKGKTANAKTSAEIGVGIPGITFKTTYIDNKETEINKSKILKSGIKTSISKGFGIVGSASVEIGIKTTYNNNEK